MKNSASPKIPIYRRYKHLLSAIFHMKQHDISKMLSFRAANIRRALEQGEADARAFISRPLDYLEA